MHFFQRFLSFTLLVFVFAPLVLYAQNAPFVQESGQRHTVTAEQLATPQAQQTKTTVSSSGHSLIVPDTSNLVIVTGPENDMLSYRIQSIRNPTIIVHAGARIHILFVNVDDDMTHDLRFGGGPPPDTTGSVGSERLPHSENESYSAEDITIRAVTPGKYPYFCSYGSHAKNGMKGWIIVTKPDASTEEMMQISTIAPQEINEGNDMNGMGMGDMEMAEMNRSHSMQMAGILRTEPMSQDGSGTSWQPASTPMYMSMYELSDWSLMLHGDIMPRYDHQAGPRGANKFDAPNWGMAMLEHDLGKNGKFSADLMMSLDPITENGKGYPLLLQTGETYQGTKLVDYQHPHDLFSEVAASYSQRFSEHASGFIYLGYPGEPALGPPVFMHRISSMADPNAPLSHHWMDATHITFGVATAGVSVGEWKLEGSYFNGSEPDENRYNFDTLKLNSYSGRLSFNLTNDLAFQISSGFLKNPEGDGVNVIRSTGSAIYTRNFAHDQWWSSTVAWGENREIHTTTLQSVLLESLYHWNEWSLYGRGEYVQKTNEELNLTESPTKIDDVEELTVGLTRRLFSISSIDLDLGAQGILNVVPESLQAIYSQNPISFEIYFSAHPSLSLDTI